MCYECKFTDFFEASTTTKNNNFNIEVLIKVKIQAYSTPTHYFLTIFATQKGI